jgi:hypothetical protein
MPGNHYMPLGYCDVIDIENFLLTEIDSTFEPQVLDWVSTAEQKINRYLGYTTASGIFMEQISGELTDVRVNTIGDLMVFPKKIPINSISGLSIVKGSDSISMTLEDDSGTDKYTISPNSDYIIYPSGELETYSSFHNLKYSKGYAKLNYIAGYDTVPGDIRQAAVNLVSDIVMRHSNKEGLESITQGRVTKRYWARTDGHSDFYLDAMDLLRPYRIASRWL